MKRLAILLLTIVVLFTAVFGLSACDEIGDPTNNDNDKDNPSTVTKNIYKDVNIDSPDTLASLADTVATKLLANAPDASDEQSTGQWLSSLGFGSASKYAVSAEMILDTVGSESYFGLDMELSAAWLLSFAYNEQQGLTFATNAEVNAKGGMTLPFGWLVRKGVLAEERAAKLSDALESFDVGAEIYLDNSNAYIGLNSGAKEFWTGIGEELPSDKLKLNFDNLLSDSIGGTNVYGVDNEDKKDVKAQLSLNIADIFQWIKEYGVEAAVSTEKGWSLRLTFTEHTVRSFLTDKSVLPERVTEWLSEAVSFDKCQCTLYVSFDENNKLTVSQSSDIELSVDVERSFTVPVGLSGYVKLTSEDVWQLSANKAQLPADAEDYTIVELPGFSRWA